MANDQVFQFLKYNFYHLRYIRIVHIHDNYTPLVVT